MVFSPTIFSLIFTGCLEDLETNDFTTTTMDTFRGVPKQEDNSLSHTARLQQTRITSIPFGTNQYVMYSL